MRRLSSISFIMPLARQLAASLAVTLAAAIFVPVSASADSAMRDRAVQKHVQIADNSHRAAPQDKRRNLSNAFSNSLSNNEQLRRSQSQQFAPQTLQPIISGGQAYTRGSQPYLSASVEVSASEAKSIALKSVPGSEFLDIKLIGGKTYRVRVMKDGRRFDVFVDAITGTIS